jgi:hypothetical protein
MNATFASQPAVLSDSIAFEEGEFDQPTQDEMRMLAGGQVLLNVL